ncbi:MAG: helix-turn-helix domain-containing protein [Chloroflexi bacterium]|nr:helix-turn-helix domain-containing protein [Chloroflexota bacterium]
MPDYITLKEAARQSGLHENSLRRLLRSKEIEGYKRGWSWMVSVRSLDNYADPVTGFLLELPGPKLFLTRREDKEDE